MSHGNFDWRTSIQLADKLTDEKDQNLKIASQRAAISRAYLGAFSLAKMYAYQRGMQLSSQAEMSKNVHSMIKNYYLYNLDPQLREIGSILDKLRSDRNNADYSTSWPKLSRDYARKCVSRAKEIEIYICSEINTGTQS